jgi:hypothetical protein
LSGPGLSHSTGSSSRQNKEGKERGEGRKESGEMGRERVRGMRRWRGSKVRRAALRVGVGYGVVGEGCGGARGEHGGGNVGQSEGRSTSGAMLRQQVAQRWWRLRLHQRGAWRKGETTEQGGRREKGERNGEGGEREERREEGANQKGMGIAAAEARHNDDLSFGAMSSTVLCGGGGDRLFIGAPAR